MLFNLKRPRAIIIIAAIGALAAFAWGQAESVLASENRTREPITEELIDILKKNPELERLLIQSIDAAKKINPDKTTNPAQSIEEFYKFVDWSVKAMPWNVLKDADYPSIFEQIDQSVDYVYFLLDQPLPELEGKGYYYNSIQYVPELAPWIVRYCQAWAEFLSSEESWNDEYYQLMRREQRFNLDKGWYEDPSNWRTWNDFFARKLSSPDVRPIASPDDDSIVVSPADSSPQGVWRIDENSVIISNVRIKSSDFASVDHLLGGDSKFMGTFAGGTLSHTFLNVDDYHRFHFPVSGVVKEARIVPEEDAAGGITVWDADRKRYVLQSSEPGWQSIETRGCVVIETREYGNVAVLPVGMSQISSVVFEDTVKVGAEVKKGDKLGYFLFGGSDIVMIFEKGAGFEMTVPSEGGAYSHVFMGQEYGRFVK